MMRAAHCRERLEDEIPLDLTEALDCDKMEGDCTPRPSFQFTRKQLTGRVGGALEKALRAENANLRAKIDALEDRYREFRNQCKRVCYEMARRQKGTIAFPVKRAPFK